jgi:hypothetical protein
MTIPSTPRDIIPPLFDPQLVKMTDRQALLQGYQIHVDPETGAARQFLQCWIVRPVLAFDSTDTVGKRI